MFSIIRNNEKMIIEIHLMKPNTNVMSYEDVIKYFVEDNCFVVVTESCVDRYPICNVTRFRVGNEKYLQELKEEENNKNKK